MNRGLSHRLAGAGEAGSVGWEGDAPLPFTLPAGGEMISGLLPLPLAIGPRTAVVTLSTGETRLRVRLADVREPWPIAGLRDGFPVDAQGDPVVLVDHRRDPAAERKWEQLATALARPPGRPLLVGDPLAALGADAWAGVEADCRTAIDLRFPQHAVLAALADLPVPAPRTIIWCPGNGVLAGGAWSAEEERVIGAIRSRCGALGVRPRLVLALPPEAVEGAGVTRALADERRALLTRSAVSAGWDILDLAAIAGPAAVANRVADGVAAAYPLGPARERIQAALRAEAAR